MKSSVKCARERIAALAAAGTPAFEVVVDPLEWERLKAEHVAALGHVSSVGLTGVDVFGVRVRLAPGTRGCVLRHDHGVQFEPSYIER